ncbi:NIPSNAP family protein [Streptosporangium sp. NPDC087985]|uniref:NIPSNAP family protein n=1 Tax=Streptosporangium sp. NPDC087985 TaxID=3366196 RepID=UPI0037F6325F
MNVIELRQYTLRPGQRDLLIDLFDLEFVESQEALGARVVGQFRDEDNPNRFVWIRGFSTMQARREALTAFYVEGEVWKAHGPAANATMLDSSDVLLLRPAGPHSGFPEPASARPPKGAHTLPSSRVVATIYHLDAPADEEFIRFFSDRVAPLMAETAGPPLAGFQTEHAENTFPRLPVRTGENVFVWFSSFADSDHHREHTERLAQSAEWNESVLPELSARLSAPPRHLRLAPTARSQLR